MPLKRPSAVAAAKAAAVEDIARLVVDIPAELHRAMKIRAVHEGRTLRDYLIDVLSTDMASWGPRPRRKGG